MRWEHWKLRWEGFRKRSHRYSGLVSFAGVTVVLVTFIVKDVMMDRQRERVTELEAAKKNYDSFKRDDNTYSKLDDIRDQLSEVLSNTRKNQNESENLRDEWRRHVERARRYFVEKWTDWFRPVELQDIFPEELEIYRQDSSKQETDIQKKQDRLNDLLNLIRTSTPSEIARIERWEQDARQIVDDLDDFHSKVAEHVLWAFSQKVDDEEKKLHFFSLLTYFLYPLGIAIGVVGQIVGVKTAGGE